MLIGQLGLGDHIVYINLHGSSSQLLEYLVHQMLVSSPSILEAKLHHHLAVEALSSDEAGLILIGGVHHDLIVA